MTERNRFTPLYNVCRASGGSVALIESAVRRTVQNGGIAVSAWEMAQISAAVRESWQTSGGSRALFEAGLKKRLGQREGGKKFMAALSLFCTLQGTFAPLAQAAFTSNVSTNITSAETVNDGSQHVSAGGVTNGNTIDSDGSQYISSGGTANSTTVNSGGTQYISSGGTANSTTVNSEGRQYISSGGTANSTTVNSGGIQHISSGGTANSTTVNSGGTQHFSGGGTANFTTVNSHGAQYISSGGTANSTTVNSGGWQIISSGGTANSTTVSSGGTLSAGDSTATLAGTNVIHDGGSLTGTGISLAAGATLELERNSTSTETMIFTGSGSLIKTGTGTLTLSGANKLTGMTTVETGTLALSGSGTISDKLTLLDGASFNTGDLANPFWNGSGAQANLAQLDVHGSATYTGDLNVAGGAMNFHVPSTMSSGATLLDVSGSASIAGSTVNVGIAGASMPLAAGDQIILINTAGGLSGAPINSTSGQGMQGVTLKYELDLTQTTTQLLATVHSEPTVTEQSKSLSEGYLSGTSFLSQGSDFLSGQGLAAARSAVAEGNAGSPEVFAALGYGKIHHQTGSSVAVKGYKLVTGLAFGHRIETANLTAALFFEYGNGDYNSTNSFSTGKVQGRGDTGYKGLGLLARSDFSNGVHIEGSLRGGKIDSDYRSNELVDAQGNRASYDTKTGYIGAHIGAGKRWTLNERNSIETDAQGIWTRQGDESAQLSTGERLKFDEIDSKRLRIGTRVTHVMSGTIKVYAGLAIEREFGGEAKATTNGFRIDAPKLKGNTGIGELGITATPSAGKPLFLEFGIQGYAGKREGVTGSLRVNYFF
jgi:autotransporter passenger strand-loop-strand repeat protein/autotransporter-associated beta strand protein